MSSTEPELTTPAAIRALPDGTVLRSASGRSYETYHWENFGLDDPDEPEDSWFNRQHLYVMGTDIPADAADVSLPATVLYHPSK